MTQIATLANGLTVITRPMPGLETASIALFADVGSRHEEERLNGLAHLFEHMVFKGAGGRSARQISEAIEDVGGELNACTERDQTSFTAAVLSDHVGLAVELIGDLVCRPAFEAAELEREAEVVLQELAEAEDTPSDIIFDHLWSQAFSGQALGRSILGSEESVRAIREADLFAWRDRHYRGASMVLSAAGAVEHDAVVALAQRYLGALGGGSAPDAAPARFTAAARHEKAKADQAQITLAYAGPGQKADDYLAARLFADIAGGGASSRLFQAVREDRGLAYTVSAGLHGHDEVGLLHVHAATARAQARAAQALIEDVLHQTAAGLEQRELDRARIQVRAGQAMALETPWGQAAQAARQWLVHGRLIGREELGQRLAALTVEQVRAAGARMLAGAPARATFGVAAAKAA
ncbi:putative Zn-dependent peptidase [Sphingomonas kaistensis]|uniref:Putative Zn-dependent peptidase n=1 Tax=Sphingomonas kaistensis TaxID=298708 RepID=A0A7X5Y4L6_9SPHN|nr:putative Zn-dependent peptidase [Sphingomonas kaistensis]